MRDSAAVSAPIVAAVIAGGSARRFGGRLKPLLEVEGQRILDRQLHVLRALKADIVLSVQSPELYAEFDLPYVTDAVVGLGPLAGISAALSWANGRSVLAVAGDMPFLSVDVIHGMLAAAGEFDAVVPRVDGRLQPLHAIYAPTCAQVIDDRLRAGLQRARDLFTDDRLRVCELNDNHLRRWDPSLRFATNVNRPQDVPTGQTVPPH